MGVFVSTGVSVKFPKYITFVFYVIFEVESSFVFTLYIKVSVVTSSPMFRGSSIVNKIQCIKSFSMCLYITSGSYNDSLMFYDICVKLLRQ
jgi:hypothetical protein